MQRTGAAHWPTTERGHRQMNRYNREIPPVTTQSPSDQWQTPNNAEASSSMNDSVSLPSVGSRFQNKNTMTLCGPSAAGNPPQVPDSSGGTMTAAVDSCAHAHRQKSTIGVSRAHVTPKVNCPILKIVGWFVRRLKAEALRTKKIFQRSNS